MTLNQFSGLSICIKLPRWYSALKPHPLPCCHKIQANAHLTPQWFWWKPLESLRSDLKTYSHPCNFVLGKLRPRQKKWPTQGPHIWLVSKPRPYLPVPGSQSRALFICFSIRMEHLSLPSTPTPFPFPFLHWNTSSRIPISESYPKNLWTQTLI